MSYKQFMQELEDDVSPDEAQLRYAMFDMMNFIPSYSVPSNMLAHTICNCHCCCLC